MHLRFAERIKNEAENLGLAVDVIPDYRGRGMFGRTTAALSVPSIGNLLAAVANAAIALQRDESESEVEMFLEAMTEIQKDLRGRNIVVY